MRRGPGTPSSEVASVLGSRLEDWPVSTTDPIVPPRGSAARDEAPLATILLRALDECSGMNAQLQAFLDAVAAAFAVDRLVLYDYDEAADRFELLFFRGYPPDARSALNRRLAAVDLRRACTERAPYRVGERETFVPLYFHETLEALLVLDGVPAVRTGSDAAPSLAVVGRFLALFLSSARLPMNRSRLQADAADLQRAREVQRAYLPSEYPATARYETYGFNRSSALVGGDYFDFFDPRPGAIHCVVADACGHGMSAALIMSTFRGLLRSEIGTGGFDGLCGRLNRQIHAGGERLQYLTTVLFEYQETAGVFRYYNAGHFDPLIVPRDGASYRLSGGGPPLGMFRDSAYELAEARVAAGDLLVLFTDGLVELRGERDEFFGVHRIQEAVESRRRLPLADLAREVLDEAAAFATAGPPEDDLTLFLMRFQ